MFRSPIFNYSGKPIYPIRRWGGVERAARQASASLLHQPSSGDTFSLSGSSSDSPRKSRWQGFKNFFSNLFNGFSSCRSSSEVSGGSRESGENINETGGTNTDATAVQNFEESVETSKECQNTPVEEPLVETESTPALKKTETSVVREKLVASPSAEPREQSIKLKEEISETAKNAAKSVEQSAEGAIDDAGDEVDEHVSSYYS